MKPLPCRALVTSLLLLATASSVRPADAVEVVLATGASATTGRGARVRGVSLFALRDLLPHREEGHGTRALDLELIGSPAVLLDATASGGIGLNLTRAVWRSVRIGAGGWVRRDGLEGSLAALRTGYELSGGAVVPLGSGAGLDLSARYACQTRELRPSPAPDRFAERYWTLTAGLAFEW